MDLICLSACEILGLLRAGEVTPLELLDALEQRIGKVDGQVNALPTLCFERARTHAQKLMQLPIEERGLLCGMPVPIKDLTTVAGVRTTFGSMLHEHFVPEQSDFLVQNIEANGGIVYAKSNTPEFGAGGNTFNDVFGATRNPYDLNRSAGGSSGGAAAALASGTAWLAHGSDLAGSLRTPASFCGVVSLRPSPGLISSDPGPDPFYVQPQEGPMARNIADLALFTDALVGQNSMAAISKPAPGVAFLTWAQQPNAPKQVAFSADLGVTQTSTEVLAVVAKAMQKLTDAGISITSDQPDLSDAQEAFDVPRALAYGNSLGDGLDANRHLIKPEVVWNAEQGLALSGDQIRSAKKAHAQVFASAAAFMSNYDVLICPAAIVPAIPIEERYLGFSEGVEVPDYYRWLAIASAITATSLPVITLPCGTTNTGLPVGLQLIGKPHGDQQLFAIASHIEAILGCNQMPVERLNPI